jgi:hypothetical protein
MWQRILFVADGRGVLLHRKEKAEARMRLVGWKELEVQSSLRLRLRCYPECFASDALPVLDRRPVTRLRKSVV